MKLFNSKSFTLVETLVTVVISTAVFAGIYSTYIVGNRTWLHYNDAIAARREARRALWAMAGELRAAENVKVVQGPDGSVIHFQSPSDGPVSFVWNRKGADAHKILRYNRAEKRVLAQHISALSFQKSKNAVVINVMASKQTMQGQEGGRAQLKEKIALRGKTKYFR